MTRDGADPNAAGNHRKNLALSLETSLRRLRTDYIDLYWVHLWDRHTPIEETMRALDDAVRAGKILYVGISDTPAWVVSRANTLAEWRGWTPFAGLQVPLQPAQPRHRARTAADGGGVRDERRHLGAAGRRRPLRQVHPPRRPDGRHPGPPRLRRRTRPRPPPGPCRRSPTSWASPRRRSPSPGPAPGPAPCTRSSAPAALEQLADNLGALDSAPRRGGRRLDAATEFTAGFPPTSSPRPGRGCSARRARGGPVASFDLSGAASGPRPDHRARSRTGRPSGDGVGTRRSSATSISRWARRAAGCHISSNGPITDPPPPPPPPRGRGTRAPGRHEDSDRCDDGEHRGEHRRW